MACHLAAVSLSAVSLTISTSPFALPNYQLRAHSPLLLVGGPGERSALFRREIFDSDSDGVLSEAELKVAVENLAKKVTGDVVPVDRDVILQVELYKGSLWRQWRGTVWEVVWPRIVKFGLYTATVCALVHLSAPEQQWGVFSIPKDVEVVTQLSVVENTWGYLSSITTFTLTFFLSQCYGAWRTTFTLARQMQGRLMDMCLSLSSHARRDQATGEYTAEAVEMLNEVTRLSRAAHVLHWMSNDIALRLLHADAGIDALTEQGLLTPTEAGLIKDSEGPVNPRWQMPLAWLTTRVARDAERGSVLGGDAFHLFFLENVGKLRGNMGSMQDETTDRMPLAYIHLVEVLVDALLVIAPLALYPETGDLSVRATRYQSPDAYPPCPHH